MTHSHLWTTSKSGLIVVLTEALFVKLAGWEAVKHARALLASDRVLSSEWQPPLLRGMVQEVATAYRAGLVIKGDSDAENVCTCRESRQRGVICAHSIAVGMHHLKSLAPAVAQAEKKPATKSAAKSLRRAADGENGEPLELFFILPPNFAQAVAKERIMLCIEGKWRQGRVPLNALPTGAAFALSEKDSALLDAIEKLSGGEAPAMLSLNAAQLAELLLKLAGHTGVTFGRAQNAVISDEPLRPAVRAALEASGEIVLRMSEALPAGGTHVGSAWIFSGQKLQPLGIPESLEKLIEAPLRIPRTRVPQFLNLDWPELVAGCDLEADFTPEDFTLESARPRFKLNLAGSLTMLQAKLDCFYNTTAVTPGVAGKNEALWLADPYSLTHYGTRNFDAERAAVARLLNQAFTGPDAKGFFQIKGQNAVLNFFAREYPRLQKEWDVTLEERLERTTQKDLERIEPRFEITSSGEQWFELNISYETGGGRGEPVAPADIQRLLLSGQSHTRLKNGKFALVDTGAVEELQEVLLDCAPRQHSDGYRIGNVQAGFLDNTLRVQNGWQVQAPATWTQPAAQQRGEVKLGAPPLGELETVLRPYQKDGVAWLHFLRSNSFGGILADEMGLGKTLQVLALLNALRSSGSATKPSLVVCPTSLVFNWAAEAAKFTPALRVLALHGSQRRELFPQIAQHHLVITSYALLRRDAENYRGTEFDTVVLDEAQHIKNRQTQNAQAVKAIHAQHRLVLTGTPIENSVLDLWSVFDFLMPGYLGNAQDFRERYEQPIVRDKNVAVQNRLARRLRPFMLRRLKREVAADLPEKIEQVSYCELNESQRAIYQQVLDASRREILSAVDANGSAKSRMVVLTALLRLRQICCDLRLLEALGDKAPETSGKLEMFDELLEEVLDGGHRVLVFSQFTTMLALLRERLTASGIEFSYLDGSTKDRAQVVEKFQRDARIPVFLISLKAGGTGLNLTGADTVIHFDPWWNPAVEAQATDRAHRIGQKNVVTSYKLITRGTVEEKILNLQNRKRTLTQGLLGGEEQLVESLTWDEINDLLAG